MYVYNIPDHHNSRPTTCKRQTLRSFTFNQTCRMGDGSGAGQSGEGSDKGISFCLAFRGVVM
ncbi:hypothetical protein F9C07_10125 [Aspergillus flavus]|uniref:Uncharacterized protein n=1 Tax=Aspergillus flavus (strain ATCC 200026 / FGSC A1120 / IAM 13836 / NRRL 3357 / JCM 12722 / SRRC 167) TaxID=332952 RepID=A0A7U2MWA4_ASPFN|nr:hypothetical protein F9C07_10125 [Aspergillus flavus]